MSATVVWVDSIITFVDTFVVWYSIGIPGTSLVIGQPKDIFITDDCKLFQLYNFEDSTSFKMNTADIPCEYQTEDITIDDEFSFARWEEFSFTARSSIAGASVAVEYSIDNGASWKPVNESPVYLSTSWETNLVHFDVVSRVIRMRFVQTSKDLQIKDDMFISFIAESEKEIEVK